MKGLKKPIIKKHGSELNLISERHEVVFVSGIPLLDNNKLEKNDENLPVLVLQEHPVTGWRAEPVETPTAGNYGWFPGGNYLAVEIDGQNVEVPIWDRQETPEQYAFFNS